jgi:hypothetical protein
MDDVKGGCGADKRQCWFPTSWLPELQPEDAVKRRWRPPPPPRGCVARRKTLLLAVCVAGAVAVAVVVLSASGGSLEGVRDYMFFHEAQGMYASARVHV